MITADIVIINICNTKDINKISIINYDLHLLILYFIYIVIHLFSVFFFYMFMCVLRRQFLKLNRNILKILIIILICCFCC